MKTKAQKIYDGEIYYDWKGNLLNYTPYNQRTRIKADQISGNQIMGDEYNYTTKMYDKYLSLYSLTDLNFKEFDTPVQSWNGTETFVGEIDSHFIGKNFIFDDELKYIGHYRGQNSAGLSFESVPHGKHYSMFLTNFDEVVGDMAFGILKGRFTFTKRGQKFGIRLLK